MGGVTVCLRFSVFVNPLFVSVSAPARYVAEQEGEGCSGMAVRVWGMWASGTRSCFAPHPVS